MLGLAAFIFILGAVEKKEVEDSKAQTIEWEVQKIYTPRGFDDNDVAQFIIEGEFPSSCYRLKKIIVSHPDLDNRIYFQVLAYKFLENCEPIVRPFIRAVDADILAPGDFTVWNTKIKEGAIGSLHIRETKSPRRDDFLYAPVDSAFVTWSTENQLSFITLGGTFTNSCYVFDREKFWVVQTDKDLIEILPVIKKEARADCRDGKYSFRERFWLSNEIPSGRYMIHIRTMDGDSFNKSEYIKNEELKGKALR